MQLSAHKTFVSGALPGKLAEEARWGGDLMDVNADADDWSTYLRLFRGRRINKETVFIHNVHTCGHLGPCSK
jgi:hypothetical protein